MVNFKENYHFSRFQRGSNIFQGGSNCLFPIETHIICDFPGRVRIPCPPLDLLAENFLQVVFLLAIVHAENHLHVL